MKKKCLPPLLFLLLTLNSFAQEIQPVDTTKWLCNYNYEFFEDSTSRYSLKSDQMVLQIGSRLSKFSCVTNYILDSVLYLNHGKITDFAAFANLSAKSVSGVSSSIMSMYKIFKNYPHIGLMVFTAYDDHKFYKIEQPMQMDWKLDDQKDTIIMGYTCKKAYTSYAGRDYVAWYSLHVPLSNGPYKFNGLPGLILKISDTKNLHCFTLTSIKKVTYIQPITYNLSNFTDISAEEYIKIMKNKMMRLYGTLQSGSVTFSSEEAKAKSLNGLKTKNNFIEKF